MKCFRCDTVVSRKNSHILGGKYEKFANFDIIGYNKKKEKPNEENITAILTLAVWGGLCHIRWINL
jgi:hypothetical protein